MRSIQNHLAIAPALPPNTLDLMDRTSRKPLICQWCQHAVSARQATWWDGRPQCPDAIRCQARIPTSASDPERSK